MAYPLPFHYQYPNQKGGSMNLKKCKHLKVSFLGLQQTKIPGKELALYNCDRCGTTISIPIINVHSSMARSKRVGRAAAKV